jgi:hypothetical protein
MRRTPGGNSTVPPGVLTHVPFMHVPLHGRLQPPQWSVSDATSTQALLHNIWPEAEQPHTPPLHTEPAGHALPHSPQLSALFVTFTQAPAPHCRSPAPQVEVQALLLQTCPVEHAFVQLEQWDASGATQAPPHASKPALHWHWPAWQVCPAPHALPQAPQFC